MRFTTASFTPDFYRNHRRIGLSNEKTRINDLRAGENTSWFEHVMTVQNA